MARRSKLDWMKDLRGADLSSAEFRVLVILATYSDKSLLNAHPGVKRLVEDTGMARSTVITALKTLQERGWIRMTQEGGNQYGKGIANVYSLHTPVIHKGPTQRPVVHRESGEKTLKGPAGLSLVAGEGSDSQAKGPMSGHQGSDSRAAKGLVNRTPSGHTSGQRSGPPLHHSDRNLSGSRPAPAPRAADPWKYDADGALSEDSYEHLCDYVLGGLDDIEANTVDGMLANGAHPQAVINTINNRRASA